MRLIKSMLVVVILAVVNSGCGSKQEAESGNAAPSKKAILGIKGVRLSQTTEAKDDGAAISAGTKLIVEEERGLALLVRLPDGTQSWCRHAYVCTEREWKTRNARQEVPDTVTFLGIAEGGSYTMYGKVPIRNNRVSLIPGQALWLDEKLCEAKPEMDWGDEKVPTRTDALYLVSDQGLTVLPAWPNDRASE